VFASRSGPSIYCVYCSHFFATIPSGGVGSTFFFPTSSQLVDKTVPPDSVKLFIIAFFCSSLPLEKNVLKYFVQRFIGTQFIIFGFFFNNFIPIFFSRLFWVVLKHWTIVWFLLQHSAKCSIFQVPISLKQILF